MNLNMKTARKSPSPTQRYWKVIEVTSEIKKDLKTCQIHILLFVNTSERNDFHWLPSIEFIFGAILREGDHPRHFI